MLIQIDHIAVSSVDFAEHIEIMRLLGYKPIFIERKVKNLQIKRGLLVEYSKEHDLALLTSSGNIGIELIKHGHINPSDGYIIPVFEYIQESFVEKTNKKFDVYEEGRLKGFDAPIYILNNKKNNFHFNKVVIKTGNIRESIAFWECFGFKILQDGDCSALLEFRSLFRDTCTIYLQKSDVIEDKHFLDDRGFNCIAFISNSTKREKDHINKKGIKTTEIEEFSINKKTFNIFFAIGRYGELVEIIGIEGK